MCVTISTSRHTATKRYSAFDGETLTAHTNSSSDLVRHALAVLARIYRDGYSYTKAGVMVRDVQDERAVHNHDLFGVEVQPLVPLMETLDALARRFGSDMVHFGIEGNTNAWDARHTLLSPRYTSVWEELPVVRH